jgi:hypothetical protein
MPRPGSRGSSTARILYEHSSRYVFLIADAARLQRSRTEMEVFYTACVARDGEASEQAIGRPDHPALPERSVRPIAAGAAGEGLAARPPQ